MLPDTMHFINIFFTFDKKGITPSDTDKLQMKIELFLKKINYKLQKVYTI